MTDKWNMIVDVALCENCQNCVLSNKDEHVDQAFPGYAAPMPKHGADWIRITRRVRGEGHHVDTSYLVTMCNHCDNAPCVAAGKGAVRQRPDGIVVIDPTASKGRKDLVEACPYGNIWWNEAEKTPQAWTFDAHLIDQGWSEPRASHACPTQALSAIKCTDEAMKARAASDGLQTLGSAKGARPRVWYRNLYRHAQDFVAGTVLSAHGGVTDVVVGATVTLSGDGKTVATAKTDMFGDFKFDGLVADGRTLDISVSTAAGDKRQSVRMSGTIVLPPIEI